ncbi:MAG: CHAT domain-containing protein, partial [Acidobacteriota bacterium]
MTESIDAPLACFTIRFQPRTSGGFPIEATASDGRRLARDFLPPTTLDQSGVTARAVPGPRGWRDLSGGPSVLPEDLGAGLFAALISGEMEALYREDLGRNDGALALVLVFDPDDLDHLELYAWPWERLQDGERILVLSGRPVVRRLTVDQPTPPAPLRVDRLRILAIPVDDTDLDLDAEVESLRTIRDNGGPFDLVVREQSPNRVELRRMLADGGFHVLHIMGHGRWSTSDRSWVLDLAGEAISAAELGDLVAQELHDTRLVVLNTCHSARGLGVGGEVDAGLAISLVRHGALAVVANRAPISDAAAGLLTDGLYRQLAAGMAVAEALGDARRDLRAGETRRLGVHRDEWSTPVLLLRSSTTVLDDRLFVLDPATRRPPTLGVAALGLGAFGVGGLAATGAAWLAHPPELLAAVPAAVLGAKVAWRWLRGEATTSSLLTAWATRLA